MPQPASQAANMRGMGVVRAGPAVVGARPTTPSAPRVMPRRSVTAAAAATGLTTSQSSLHLPRVPKRSLEASDEDDLSLAATSPNKRRVLPSSFSLHSALGAPFYLSSSKTPLPHSLLSPNRSTKVYRAGEPPRLGHSPLRGDGRPSLFGLDERPKSPVRMLLAEEQVDEAMMLGDAAVFRQTAVGPEDLHDSSSDDEIDWLSPKKGDGAVSTQLESPLRLPRSGSTLKLRLRPSPPRRRSLGKPDSQRATSVPMERQAPAVLPPAFRQTTLPFVPGSPRAVSAPPRSPSALRTLPGAAMLQLPVAQEMQAPLLSINPALLMSPTPATSFGSAAQSLLPPPTTGLVSKRGLAPIPGSPYHSNLRSVPAPPTPGAGFRSGIPRLAALPLTPSVIPPTPAMDIDVGSVPVLGPAGSATSATAARLQNLQGLLARLSQPRRDPPAQRRTSLTARRPASAPVSANSSLDMSITGDSVVPLAPEGSMGPPLSRSARTSMPPPAMRAAPSARRHSIAADSTVVAPSGRSTAAITAAFTPADCDRPAGGNDQILRGVVALVDVRTGEGDDAGMLFVSMLKDMGARVCTRPVPSLTHVVFKGGRPATLARARATPAGSVQPFVVGIGWVVQCAEKGERVSELDFKVEEESKLAVPRKVSRVSMGPKPLASLSSYGSFGPGCGGGGVGEDKVRATIAESIARARQRSLAFKPKVGSPLARRVGVSADDLE